MSCGTITGYYGRGCRCAECREAARAYFHVAAKEPRRACSAPACDRPARVRGRYCDGHLRRVREGRPLDEPLGLPNGSDAAGYDAAHKRVKRAKGSAADRWCEHCDSPASQWAFVHGSPDTRPAGVKRNGRPHGPFSLDPDHYMPLCSACHKVYDLAQVA